MHEAQKTVPKVSRILNAIYKVRRGIDLLDSINIQFEDQNLLNSYTIRYNKEYFRLSYLFFKRLAELEKVGCIIKDLDLGLIDFLSYFEGKEIFLCWKFGERKIVYWHETDAGYAGRKHISKLRKEVHKN